jgi:N-sulfoglucosamine sulfohydrolase
MKTLALLFLSLSIGLGHALAAEKNIIFFITDDESPTLGCYGDTAARTPAIDEIAEPPPTPAQGRQ